MKLRLSGKGVAAAVLLLGLLPGFAAQAQVHRVPAQALTGDAAAGKAKSLVCQACHGADGNSAIPMYPKLAGQNASYLKREISYFRDGKRVDVTMAPMVANLSDQDIADIAAYYSSQEIKIGAADPQSVDRGAELYHGGDFDRKLPACMGCHGPNGHGNTLAVWPALRGQQVDYVIKQLKDYRDDKRATDPNQIMRDVAKKLTDKDIQALAQYINGLH